MLSSNESAITRSVPSIVPSYPALINAEDNIKTFDVVELKPDDVTGAVLAASPSESSVQQLQRWLQCRRLNKQGNKADLVKRVEQSMDLDLPIDPNVDNGGPYRAKAARVVTMDMLLEVKDVAIPVIMNNVPVEGFPISGWVSFPSRDVPDMFNYGSVLFYIVESLGNVLCQGYDDGTHNQMKKGVHLKDSGFVHNVTDNQQGNFYFISGHVNRSMVNATQHVKVAISLASGSIQLANCSGCVVEDLARCCHIAALLLYLNDHVKANGYKCTKTSDVPCTSLPCSWN